MLNNSAEKVSGRIVVQQLNKSDGYTRAPSSEQAVPEIKIAEIRRMLFSKSRPLHKTGVFNFCFRLPSWGGGFLEGIWEFL